MSEPSGHARKIVRVVPTVHRWRVHDDRIGGRSSDSYAVVVAGRVTLIDPLPVDEEALRRLGRIQSIVLTCANHQRSAWRYRRSFGAAVWAPDGPTVGMEHGQLEEEPDVRYSGGDSLPNGLSAFHSPGHSDAMFTLWLDKPRSVVFLPDLLTHDGEGTPALFQSGNPEMDERARASLRRLVDHLPVEVICFTHGVPICADGRMAIERVLHTTESESPGALY